MNKQRYFIIGDIHGYFIKLKKLFDKISGEIRSDDTIIFLGDYIDRGPESYEVIEFLLKISDIYNAVFLTGNHEDMMLSFYATGDNYFNYFRNGGGTTIQSYMRNNNGRFIIPEAHINFFNSLRLYYEGEDFIAVHAGLNPKVKELQDQRRDELLWLREDFYLGNRKWEKTVIFGHTPTPYLHNSDEVYYDDKRNIIGIDTYAMNEQFPLTCLLWPDRKIFQGFGSDLNL